MPGCWCAGQLFKLGSGSSTEFPERQPVRRVRKKVKRWHESVGTGRYRSPRKACLSESRSSFDRAADDAAADDDDDQFSRSKP